MSDYERGFKDGHDCCLARLRVVEAELSIQHNLILESTACIFDQRHPYDNMDIGALLTCKQVSQVIRSLKTE